MPPCDLSRKTAWTSYLGSKSRWIIKKVHSLPETRMLAQQALLVFCLSHQLQTSLDLFNETEATDSLKQTISSSTRENMQAIGIKNTFQSQAETYELIFSPLSSKYSFI
jgi:hypothetical protein